MTATDTHTKTHAADGVAEAPVGGDGLYQLVASNDHKMVGRLWIGASLLLLVGLSILGVALDIERVSLADTDLFGSVSRYFQSWALFRTGMIFMVVLPLFIGIATVVVPLQVGSASIAFPRLAAAAFWSWLFASIIHIVSFATDGGLGPEAMTRTDSTLLTLVSLAFMIIALLAASVCIATTVVALRPTGMALLRVPAFSWSMLVATSVWLFSLPVLLANLIYAYVDLQGRPPIALGQRDLLWGQLEWAWAQPQIYAYAIPVLGILADIVPVSAKARQDKRDVVFALIALTGVLSFGAWAQSFFSVGADPLLNGNLIFDEALYVIFGLAIFLPAFGAFGGVMDSIRRGSTPKVSGALIGSASGAILYLAAMVLGEIRVLPRALEFLDSWPIIGSLLGANQNWSALHDDNTLLASSTGQLGLIVAASVAASVGALCFWGPKIFGGYVKEPVAMLASMALIGGGLMIGIANLISALDGQPDISVVDNLSDLVATMNVMSLIGSAMLAVGALALVAAVIPAAINSEQLPDDPWDGHTLEWAAPSPPPVGNFVEPFETITSAEPLLDEFEEVS